MTAQLSDFLQGTSTHEEVEATTRVGFAERIDLITLRERLRKHGVQS